MLQTKKKFIFTAIFVLFSGLFFILAETGLGKYDSLADEYFENSIKKSAISYAAVRGVNSIVSVVKESRLDVTPAGVGVSVAVGEVLDPLDDMTERVSSVLVMAIVALGVEKIFFEIINEFGFFSLAVVALIISLTPYLHKSVASTTYIFLLKLLTVIVILRLLLPFSAMVSSYLHQTIFQEQIESSKMVLSKVSSQNFDMEIQRESSFLGKIRESVDLVDNKINDVKESFSLLKENMSDVINALITLVTIYIVSFIIDIIILPLTVFFIIFKGIKVYFKDV